MWTVSEDSFDPQSLHHKETIFTIGNGYLSTRGTFEEGYNGDSRATFVHGVFDDAPIVFTELANAPDWLPFTVYLNGERFSLDQGTVEFFRRSLDLRAGLLTRTVRWRSASGLTATLIFERFASLADPHLLCIRCRVTPGFEGTLEFRAALNGNTDNKGLAHWKRAEQGRQGEAVYLHNRTRGTNIDLVTAMRLQVTTGYETSREWWDAENTPTLAIKTAATAGAETIVDKHVAVFTSRDVSADQLVKQAVDCVNQVADWPSAFNAHLEAWAEEWGRTDVIIEGDDEAQLAIRFNLFQMLIAAPRHDDRVNIGAKTLSGFGYCGHAFWDTEIFILPLFIYTAPHIARNLLDYRYHTLPAARAKAKAKGFEGAWFAWESADTGEEVTPTWVPDFKDKTRLARVWTGDLAIHISADVAYAVHQYWEVTGDDGWLQDRGAELILDAARFLGARAEWNGAQGRYEYSDVIGPDEYHDHVNNNAYTNHLARWTLAMALQTLDWLRRRQPEKAEEIADRLGLSEARLTKWREIIEKLYCPVEPNGLIEQFDGFFELKDIDLADYEPRTRSMHEILGVEGANDYQIIKQPDVLMMQYVLGAHRSDESVRVNYDYYTPRTDHTYGSSLGPSIQAILACDVGKPDDAYEHFIRAVRADLRDVRGNAGDGIHAASAGGTWQSVVFGFGGLRVTPNDWTIKPQLPRHWKRLAFKFFHRGKLQEVNIVI